MSTFDGSIKVCGVGGTVINNVLHIALDRCFVLAQVGIVGGFAGARRTAEWKLIHKEVVCGGMVE